MNQRGSERGRRILCSFNSEHEFCYINSQYSTRECIGECLKKNEATVIISIEGKGKVGKAILLFAKSTHNVSNSIVVLIVNSWPVFTILGHFPGSV